jgi:hypothetical protein
MAELKDEILEKIRSDVDPFKRILGKVPGFDGYVKRQNRRDSDKLLRETIANRFEEQWKRVSALQRDFISQGEIEQVDDLEAAAIKLRTFSDRVRRATRGYSGLFDAVQINEDELRRIYEYDAALLEMAPEVSRAIDNVEASIGSEGLPAAIRHLTSIARQADELFDHREEVVIGIDEE